MELWIRSQDRETIMKIDRVDIDKEKEIWVNGYDVFVAKYKTKERALEVLDDINKVKWWKYMAELDFGVFVKILNETYNNEEIQEIFKLMNTYEMPEE